MSNTTESHGVMSPGGGRPAVAARPAEPFGQATRDAGRWATRGRGGFTAELGHQGAIWLDYDFEAS